VIPLFFCFSSGSYFVFAACRLYVGAQ